MSADPASARAPASALSRALTGLGPEDGPPPPPPRVTPVAASALRLWIGPLALMAVTPPLAILSWMISVHFGGSVAQFARTADLETVLRLVPRPTWTAAGLIAGWVAFQWLLLLALPGRTHLGPVTPMGNQPRYRLNGVAAWAVTHAAWLLGAHVLGWFPPSVVYHHLGPLLSTLTLSALVFCAFLYWKGRNWPSSTDTVRTGVLPFDFFQGIELHPRLLGVSLKQLVNCRVSMMGWSLMLVSFAGAEVERAGALSPAMAVCVGLQVAYLFKFFVWEGGYFNSLDIMHDRFGYYICWGVLGWVPAVYPLTALYLLDHPSSLGAAGAAALAALGAASLWANYAADAQRQRVRATQGEARVWGKPPVLVRARYVAGDGRERENLLLASGYWGLARHFHYVPELTLALAWSLPAGFRHFLPYFYVFYLAILLFDRSGRDERRCAAKYGAAWEEYRRRVPWRIVPGVY